MKKTILTVVLLALIAQAMVLAQEVKDINLSTLLNEIRNNSARASQDYHDKTLRITGVATNIKSNSMWLAVSDIEYWNTIQVYFNSSERTKLIDLNQGQSIIVRGIYDGGWSECLRNAVIETDDQTRPPPPEEFASYQGTWVYNGEFQLTTTITNNIFKITFNRSNFIDLTIEKWATMDNENSDFPSGYLLTVSILANNNFGDFPNTSIYIFLHKNKQSLIWSATTDGIDNPWTYNKQQ